MTTTSSRRGWHRRTDRAALVAVGVGLAVVLAELASRHVAPFELVHGDLAFVRNRRPQRDDPRPYSLGGVALWRRSHPGRARATAVKRGFRIVVLGDSVLEPAGLPDADGTVHRVGELLAARLPDRAFELVNLAEGGWSTLQEEQALLHEGLALDPDLVLLGVSPNDAQQFVLHDGQLLQVEFQQRLVRSRDRGWLARHSYLYNLLWLSRQPSAGLERSSGQLERERIVAPIERMVAMSAARGARFGILCFPFLSSPRFAVDARGCSFASLEDWARERRVPLLDPTVAYSAHANAALRLDDIHLSGLGHGVLAEEVYRWLISQGLVEGGAVR